MEAVRRTCTPVDQLLTCDSLRAITLNSSTASNTAKSHVQLVESGPVAVTVEFVRSLVRISTSTRSRSSTVLRSSIPSSRMVSRLAAKKYDLH